MIDPDAFLRQEVESATPAKLRWLLIRKAIGLCQAVEQLWSDQRYEEASQWLLRVREIFGELLDGVTDPTNPVARNISDLYSFLLSMLSAIDKGRDPVELRAMIDILQIELDTWNLFIQRENQASAFHVASASKPAPHSLSSDFAAMSEWSGLNVEA